MRSFSRLTAHGTRHGSSTDLKTLMICLVLSGFLMIVSIRFAQHPLFSSVRMAPHALTAPFLALGATITAPLRSLSNVATNLTADQKTLTDLQDENRLLTAKLLKLEESEHEAERLRALLDLKNTAQLNSVAARVISSQADTWSKEIVLDKGSLAGIGVNMCVMSEYGVVGQVMSVTPTSATVRLLTDDQSSISAVIQESRAHGMLRGSITGQTHLTLVSRQISVQTGDMVLTSGLGGVFPKGLPLGRVTSVENDPTSSYHTISVEPLARGRAFEEVLVILSISSDQQANDVEFAEADAQQMGSQTTSQAS